MEYIKKEELIEGEIYYVSTTYGFWMIGLVTKSNNGDNSNCDFRGNATFINKRLEFNKDQSWCYKGNHRTYRLVTPEEKHWLNCCITANKFITFEEAMKTFIPEYYQYIGEIDSCKSSFIKGKTYKIINKNDLEASFNFIDEKGTPNGYEGVNWKKFKPSTKEAYDAQFVVKEPLPQFKVIETIETITKVENNEGNQFFIGDVVKTEAGLHFKIIGFKYDENKTKILAIATDNYPEVFKDINDIEHYIEPKVEETLLEKAKRLYPVGTKVKTATSNNFEIIIKDQSKFKLDLNNNISVTENYMVHLYCSYKNKWAEIIK